MRVRQRVDRPVRPACRHHSGWRDHHQQGRRNFYGTLPMIRHHLLAASLITWCSAALAAPTAPGSTPMSDAVETSVAAHLGAYDKTHAPLELREAADAAARFDGATWPDAQANLYAARARVADWVAILGRVK